MLNRERHFQLFHNHMPWDSPEQVLLVLVISLCNHGHVFQKDLHVCFIENNFLKGFKTVKIQIYWFGNNSISFEFYLIVSSPCYLLPQTFLSFIWSNCSLTLLFSRLSLKSPFPSKSSSELLVPVPDPGARWHTMNQLFWMDWYHVFFLGSQWFLNHGFSSNTRTGSAGGLDDDVYNVFGLRFSWTKLTP
jgi:hypothetical protein